ncbi:hypothetical protein SGR_176 [Streptomyces griseus subsp. griseus NBRC 13350]|uniref:Uncharacterized protein n=1 Tax=Streptomyces griseus subsp. griseus (strain JCM 4626 / CBS 651.72 / NBRC 13350 / KCC S-0626 / ISP 5235) TaxID=455632 RepID=B1VNI2_STRGG|nr:hypothetical protein SGR_176 [Streptomyces griseus subsp. griseus NBRC 13350]
MAERARAELADAVQACRVCRAQAVRYRTLIDRARFWAFATLVAGPVGRWFTEPRGTASASGRSLLAAGQGAASAQFGGRAVAHDSAPWYRWRPLPPAPGPGVASTQPIRCVTAPVRNPGCVTDSAEW